MSESESFFASVKKWFANEATEAAEVKRDLGRRLDKDITRRDADLNASPSERLEGIQTEIDGGESSFDEIRAKIDAQTTRAELDKEEIEGVAKTDENESATEDDEEQ